MLPDQALSTDAHPAAFLPPRNVSRHRLEEFELGGVGLQDPSQGLQVYTWRGRYVDGDFILDVPGVVAPTIVLSVPNVTEFGFTFDQNMQPAVAYMVDGVEAHLYWFDPTVPGFVTIDLPAGSFSPRLSLDDKRNAAGTLAAASDIILTYLRAGALYFRAERDRFTVEYLLRDSGIDNYELGQFGMNRLLRMQWQLVPVTPNPVPMIASLVPDSVVEGSAGFTLTVNGTGFVRSSRVRWNGASRPTTYVSTTVLRAEIFTGDVLLEGTANVTVRNPLPGGGESAPEVFTIEDGSLPLPSITSIVPDTAMEGGPGFTLTVNGTGFVAGQSVVRWNGANRPTTFISLTELEAAIPQTDIATEGTANVTVFNPGGGESAPEVFTVSPAPWTPADIATSLWLDADDADTIATAAGAVTQWDDKSGNGHHFTPGSAAARPSYMAAAVNGRNVIRCDGVDDYLTAAGALINETHSLFICFRPTIAAANGVFLSQYNSAAAGRLAFTANANCVGATAAGSLATFIQGTTGGACALGGGAGLPTHGTVANAPTLLGSLMAPGAEGWQTYLNGALVDSMTPPIAIYKGAATELGRLPGFSEPYAGDYLEVLLIDGTKVDDALRQIIEGYFAHRWGFASELPVGHPYRDSPP